MKTKVLNLKMIFILLGVMFSLPSMAIEYGDSLEVKTQGQILNADKFVLNVLGTRPYILTRIKVKNGVEFYIQLPEGHAISHLNGGIQEGDMIKVSKAGTLDFRFNYRGTRYYVLSHVNYYGVARYPGATGNEVTNGQTITITSDADLEKEIGFFEEMRGMEIYWQKDLYNFGTWTIFSDETQNIKKMKLSAILDQAERQKTFKLRISTSDGTPNGVNGHRLGLVHLDITIKDLRDPKTLEVNPTIVSFPENGGSQSVRVTSNQTWNASSNQTWVSVSPASGTNDGSFTVSAASNTSQQPRTASITVTGGGLSKTITVNQAAALPDPVLELTPSSISAPANGKTEKVTVTSNQTWNASSNQAWVSVSPASGTNDGSFTVSVESNTSQQSRTASITVTGGGLSKTITVNQAAAAPPQTYSVSLSAQPAEGGSVQGAGTFNENSQVTVTATANNGYKFVKWTEDGVEVSTSASYQFKITKNRNLVAVFEPVQVQTYTVSLSAQPADGGSVQGTGTFNENSQVTVTATANNGYKFVKWTEDGVEVSTSASYQFKITSNRKLVAVFEPIPPVEYSITVAQLTNGAITPSVNKATKGTEVSLEIKPVQNYRLREGSLKVIAQSGVNVAVSNNRFKMPAENVTISAEFEVDTAIEEVSSHPAVKIFPNPATEKLEISNAAPSTKVELYNLQGEVLISAFTDAYGEAGLDISSFPSGIYIVRVGKMSSKFIKNL